MKLLVKWSMMATLGVLLLVVTGCKEEKTAPADENPATEHPADDKPKDHPAH